MGLQDVAIQPGIAVTWSSTDPMSASTSSTAWASSTESRTRSGCCACCGGPARARRTTRALAGAFATTRRGSGPR
jgi:hypothetical protein